MAPAPLLRENGFGGQAESDRYVGNVTDLKATRT